MEHAYCPKDSFLAERGKPHSLYLFPVLFTHSVLLSSGQVRIQEEGKEDILWECKSVSSYLTSWEFLQQLVAPDSASVGAHFHHHSQRITVRAVTPCEYCVFHVKAALKQEEHDTICRLVEKGVGRLQRLITCPAIRWVLRGRFIRRELSACLGAGEAEASLQIATMYPMLYECVTDDQRSDVEMRQCVEEIVRGEGDEVLLLKKNQLVALPPYTMCAFSLGLTRSVVVLRGRIVAPEGEISVIVGPPGVV